MSEYQYYEFVALDRPLTANQMAELRALSTRAEISPTHFRNEYQWGDLKADPIDLTARYFDAHLYFANWGTHRLLLRLPKARATPKALKPYFVGGSAARLSTTGECVVLSLTSEVEEPEYDDGHDGSLATLTRLRAELMSGDLRPAYLAWLLAVSADDLKDDAKEPPVPEGLGSLTAPQRAMVEFLRIDPDLVAAAAAGSAPITREGVPFRRWLAALPSNEKDAWLTRAAEEPDLALGRELLKVYRSTKKTNGARTCRTVGELRALADIRREEREATELARKNKANAAAAAARERRLTKLGRDVEGAWRELEKLVEASDDAAVQLALDLRDLATRNATATDFARRFAALRKRAPRRRLFSLWKQANENVPAQ